MQKIEDLYDDLADLDRERVLMYKGDRTTVFYTNEKFPVVGVVSAIENFRNKVWSRTHYEDYIAHAEKIIDKIKARNGQAEYIAGIRELEQKAEAQKKSLNKKELSALMTDLMMFRNKQK